MNGQFRIDSMLTKALKSASRLPARGYFWSGKNDLNGRPLVEAKKEEGLDIVQKTKKEHEEFRERIAKTKEMAVMEYKTLPTASHWNPNSPDFVDSPREVETNKRELDSFNSLVDNLKNSIKTQEEIYNYIENMDRPYLKGTRGIEKSVYDVVKDYSAPTGVKTQSYRELEREIIAKDSNRHRFINDAVWVPRWTQETSNVKQWNQELEARKVNSHFHPDKGYKFDVFVPYEERYPHVADRLGYPEFLGDSVDRLLRLDSDDYHPNFLDQPFVQTPPINPSSELNFGEGEAIYENPAAGEWGRLSEKVGFGLLGFIGIWKPYHMILASPNPPPSVSDDLPLHYFDMNFYHFDNYMLTLPFVPPIIYMVANLITVAFILPETKLKTGFAICCSSPVQRRQGTPLRDQCWCFGQGRREDHRDGAHRDYRSLC